MNLCYIMEPLLLPEFALQHCETIFPWPSIHLPRCRFNDRLFCVPVPHPPTQQRGSQSLP